ncbi:hypothetical protein [Methylobacterium bullatum]|uniref:Uncharacterized protein n=1 Tax=Methylobacterium bullatum TaxID=570505 RepID=A0AAV4Z6I1_9HYPH|nr:hypothetical protein [Methylobacterium bullatum]MBD8901205.1 hypothetical protein [Methylobacterium bullatum]GJD39129.1 hypothetical protein OICFNHDK_1582 [Methylobacterium bullatum]
MAGRIGWRRLACRDDAAGRHRPHAQAAIPALSSLSEGIRPSVVSTIKSRITLVFVEQYRKSALRLADCFVVLSRGLVERGMRESLDHAALARHIAV